MEKDRIIDRAAKRFEEMPLPGFAEVQRSENDVVKEEIQTLRMLVQGLSMDCRNMHTAMRMLADRILVLEGGKVRERKEDTTT